MELDMDSPASNVFRAHLAGLTLCTALFVGTSAAARAEDARCDQLIALHRQYAGVALTGEQQGLKRKLMAWYNSNCGGVRRSAGR
jgi:hypothetical protein